MIHFDKEYNREEWINFFGSRFSFDDRVPDLFTFFNKEERDEIVSRYENFVYIDRCSRIGELEVEGNYRIPVYEIFVQRTRDNSKIKLFRLAVDIIRGKNKNNFGSGIFFFVYSDDDTTLCGRYRLSYVNYGISFRGGSIIKDSTNPKRYSFLLGVGVPKKTARDRLKPEAFNSVSSILEAFSVEAVNREFYLGVKKHFELINADVSKDFNNDDFLIKNFSLRFLGRILFCWFLKEKDFIDKALFDVSLFDKAYKNYYQNVLYDLFFNVLNGKMGERNINSDIIKEYENNIPFLNGGLFSLREEEKDIYSIKDSTLKSLFEFFNMYNFTVDESSAFDEEVSIDPEMLGRIFENLLAEINPETKESARKETGSFYTPREIVDYMITSSIILYLKNVTKIDASKLDKLFLIGSEGEFDTYERKEIIKAIHKIKILDPACGSGAFPIGVLQRIFYLIDKLDSEHNIYKEEILSSITNTSIRDKMKDLFANDKLNYAYKLDILKSSIYGVDIQPIAIEISRLRAFLALIVDEKKVDSETNFGIQPLPNLEFQFICANSLKSIYFNLEDGSIEKHFVDSIIDKMNKISKMFFSASSSEEKENVKHRFLEFQDFVQNCDYISDDIKEEILSWNPFENKTANFFSPIIQLGIEGKFDIIIGNPPYGVKLSKEDKEIYKKYFKSANSTKSSTKNEKGSLNTFSLFIEQSLKLIESGVSVLIVPMSVVSSDNMSSLHRLLENSCKLIKFSHYSDRPKQIFKDASTSITILECIKSPDIKNQQILSTKVNRRNTNEDISEILDSLKFIDVKGVNIVGRYPKIGENIEKNILKKLFSIKSTVGSLIKDNGSPIYYRMAGGRYYKVITNYSTTNADSEKVIYFDKKIANTIGCILSSNLYYWYYSIFSDHLNMKKYEIESFRIPIEKLDNQIIKTIDNLYKRYLIDIEKNTIEHEKSNYKNTTKFKEYKIRFSKSIIDEIDDLIYPLYGLTEEENNFIKNFESKYRMSDK